MQGGCSKKFTQIIFWYICSAMLSFADVPWRQSGFCEGGRHCAGLLVFHLPRAERLGFTWRRPAGPPFFWKRTLGNSGGSRIPANPPPATPPPGEGNLWSHFNAPHCTHHLHTTRCLISRQANKGGSKRYVKFQFNLYFFAVQISAIIKTPCALFIAPHS